jgi:hypothetical protein
MYVGLQVRIRTPRKWLNLKLNKTSIKCPEIKRRFSCWRWACWSGA